MARKIFLILIVLLILILFGWQILSNFVYKEYLTNTTELYTYFTPYMEQKINIYLDSVDCRPNNYYYQNNTLCFVCNKIDVCFVYTWVERTGGQKIRPDYFYLRGLVDKQTELDFYSKGISKILNCNCTEERCVCENEINAKLDYVDKQTYQSPFVLYEYKDNVEEKINYICNKMEMGEVIFDENSFECGELSGLFTDEVFVIA
jgi:hypothetical protein